MAGANGLQNNEMLRMIQLEHLERQRRWILQQPPEKCPRCNSMETKFCYFNNYSADQQRYFCKACQRHWTKGGRLRNIPVGGSTRPGGDHVLNPQGQNPPRLVTRPGGTIPLGAVNQLHGYYVGNPQGQNPLGPVMTRSARAVTLPATVYIVRPVGTGYQNPLCHQFRAVYSWVDGFWHGPFNGTSIGPLP